MSTASRYGRAAGTIVGIVGCLLLVSVALMLITVLPILLGSEGEHMAGDATFWVVIIGVPVTGAGLLSLGVARLLWRGSRRGPVVVAAWVVIAALICAASWGAEMNLLSTLRRLLLEQSTLSIDGMNACAGSVDGVVYCGQLDDPTFWLPGVLAVASIALVGVLIAWVADPRADVPRR